jgi:hypothetical protein
MLGRSVLVIAGLMYVGFGVAFLLAPAELGALVHLSAEHPVARTELRAFYGGLEIGLGLFLLICVARRPWQAPGLLVTALVCGGTAAARVVGLLLDHSAGRTVLIILLVEVVVAAAAFLGLARQSHEQGHRQGPDQADGEPALPHG